jgi:hypothetical protein
MYQTLLEECYPSLRINIWCYPTSRVLTISCVQYLVNGLWFIFGLFEISLQIWYMYLTIGFRALSLAKEGDNFLFLFLQIFSKKKKKRADTLGSDLEIFEQNLAKQIGYLNSSRKNTQFQKTNNQPKQSLVSKVMSILNSTVFEGFFGKSRDFLQ